MFRVVGKKQTVEGGCLSDSLDRVQYKSGMVITYTREHPCLCKHRRGCPCATDYNKYCVAAKYLNS